MSQQQKALFCRISKVDEEKRTVTGIGASETPDLEGEIFDYEGSKPYIEAWSASAVARSQGKSFGNIREMHQPSAVGKLAEPIVFDDANKLVILTASCNLPVFLPETAHPNPILSDSRRPAFSSACLGFFAGLRRKAERSNAKG